MKSDGDFLGLPKRIYLIGITACFLCAVLVASIVPDGTARSASWAVIVLFGFVLIVLAKPLLPSVAATDNKPQLCLRCGTFDEPHTYRSGSMFLEVLLLLFFIVPGIFYDFWRRSKTYSGCPKCQAREIIPLDSPAALRLSKTTSAN